MFKPLNNTRIAPTLAPCLPNDMTAGLDAILEGVFADTDSGIAIIGSMMLNIVRFANLGDGKGDEIRGNCRKMFTGTTYTDALNIERFPPDSNTSKVDNVKRIQVLMTENVDNAVGWLADLINAQKKKPLDEKNVIGYFATMRYECSRPQKIAKFINMIGPYFPDMISNQNFRESLSNSVWTNYRVARCSTGSILHSNLGFLMNMGIVDKSEEVLIETAKDNPWDINAANLIPNRIVAYTSIYLTAAGRGIDNWYQAENAIKDLSTSKIRAAQTVFSKYLDITSDVDDVIASTDINSFNNSLPSNFFRE